jgi:Mn2+/Fe2+ NRAMP family transporter
MGALVNRRLTTAIAVLVAALIVALNMYLLWGIAGDLLGGGGL